nr:hypothetical protein GCM10020093_117030 [Planobispora longispora]
MRNRIWINLGFFAVLGVVMTVWAFTSIIKLDIIERPYRINAEFVSSPAWCAASTWPISACGSAGSTTWRWPPGRSWWR